MKSEEIKAKGLLYFLCCGEPERAPQRPVMSQEVGSWSKLEAWLLNSFLVKFASMSHVVTQGLMLESLSLHAEKLLHDPELLLRGIMLRYSYATVL